MSRPPARHAPQPERCTKIPYESRRDARRALEQAQAGRKGSRTPWVPKRAYKCWCGKWHFTSAGGKPKHYGTRRAA